MALTEHPWICDVCREPIVDREGAIDVFNSNPALGRVGGYPIAATPDVEIAGRKPDGSFRVISSSELEALTDGPINVGFRATHNHCDPEPQSGAYTIAVDRAPTLAAWLSRVLHLSEKSWMGKPDVVSMMTYYFDNRGINPHAPGAERY